MPSNGEQKQKPVTRSANYLQEVLIELRPPKTQWPSPPEAWRLTTVVLGVILMVGVYMALLDTILSRLTGALIK
ncbi:MAG TPA: preprotein translocase subunit SecE [Chthonomonadales bacterium]|nr:preprotein translocase subunit SecE [Chthonomonadales bacterium]